MPKITFKETDNLVLPESKVVNCDLTKFPKSCFDESNYWRCCLYHVNDTYVFCYADDDNAFKYCQVDEDWIIKTFPNIGSLHINDLGKLKFKDESLTSFQFLENWIKNMFSFFNDNIVNTCVNVEVE